MTQFESAYHEFTKRSAGVVFIAAQKIDGLFRGKEHIHKHAYPFPVLFDEKRQVTRAYGVYQALGVDTLNLARRALFVVTSEGTICRIAVSPNQREAPPFEEILGRRGASLAVHAPADAPDAAAAVAAYHRKRRAAAARVPLPLSGDDSEAGALALLGERAPSELERVATDRVAGLLALELVREEAVGRAVDTARRETLPADGPPWVVIVARQGSADADDTAERREAIRRDLRGLAPARRMRLRGDAQSVDLRAVAAALPDDADGRLLAARIAATLGRPVAVSRPFVAAGARSAAEADARATLEAAERLAAPPAVARADRLPAYRLLGNLHNLPEGERQARALLEPLLQGRPDVRRERLATLRALLDQPGLAEAAATLGVHRNTIAYRIRRIEALTGWSLADPEVRFPIALALRLVQDD